MVGWRLVKEYVPKNGSGNESVRIHYWFHGGNGQWRSRGSSSADTIALRRYCVWKILTLLHELASQFGGFPESGFKVVADKVG